MTADQLIDQELDLGLVVGVTYGIVWINHADRYRGIGTSLEDAIRDATQQGQPFTELEKWYLCIKWEKIEKSLP